MESIEISLDKKFEKLTRLKNFDFKNNMVFQAGWRKIKAVTPPESLFDSLIKAQVFYFSREVETVNFEDYKKWLTDHGTDKGQYINDHMPDPDNDSVAEKTKTQSVGKDQDCASVRDGKYPESFAELVDMLQNGLKLPDTEGPEIEPVNDEPSVAVAEKKKKPWEDN